MVDEIMSITKVFKKQYADSCKELLTELYDRDFDYVRELRGEGVIRIRDPFINIYACSTPEKFQESFEEQDIYSGFLARFSIVFAKRERFVEIPQEGDIGKFKMLVEALRLISQTKGGMSLDKGATKIFGEYSVKINDLLKYSTDMTAPFISNSFPVSLKLTMLYHLSENCTEGYITEEEMKRGIELAEKIRLSTEKLFSNIAFTPYQLHRQRLINALESASNREMQWSELTHRLRQEPGQFRKVIDGLEMEGMILVREVPSDGGTKPKKMIKLLEE
jgi:hypothetical protein